MAPLSEKTLQTCFQELGLSANIDEKSNQILSSIKIEDREFPVFCRTLTGGELVQVICFVPVAVEEKSFDDLARFLHLVNKELDMPGFGLDETTKTVFYRVIIPTVGQQFDTNTFKAFLKTIENVCSTFGVIITALAMNAMTLDEIFAEMQKKK